jgi:hypothetical protein
MAVESESIQSYINTLIFCIIAKAITVGLLVLLLTGWGWEMLYLILTVEIGMILIVAYAMYLIYKITKDIEEAKAAAAKQPPMLQVCPDYFVRSAYTKDNVPKGTSSSTSSCSKESTRVPQEGDVICDNTYTTSDGRFIYEFPLQDTLDLDVIAGNSKTMNDMCAANTSTYDSISWTDMKSRCGILDSYTIPS